MFPNKTSALTISDTIDLCKETIKNLNIVKKDFNKIYTLEKDTQLKAKMLDQMKIVDYIGDKLSFFESVFINMKNSGYELKK